MELASIFGVALFVLALAWQVPIPIRVNIGDREELYLSHYYPREVSSDRDYRWVLGTNDSRITFPGIGWGNWEVTLVGAAGTRPDGPVPLRIRAHGKVVFEDLAADPNFHTYTFSVQASDLSEGDLVLNFDINEFRPANDHRALGFAIDSVELTPLPPYFPPPVTWFALAAALTFLYGAVRLFSRLAALLSGVAAVALASYLVAAQRLFITPYAVYVFMGAGLLLIFASSLRSVIREFTGKGERSRKS